MPVFVLLMSWFTLVAGGVLYEYEFLTAVDVSVVEQTQEGLANMSGFGQLVVLTATRQIVGVYDDWPHCGGVYLDSATIVLNQRCNGNRWERTLAHETGHLVYPQGGEAFAVRMGETLPRMEMNVRARYELRDAHDTVLEAWSWTDKRAGFDDRLDVEARETRAGRSG